MLFNSIWVILNIRNIDNGGNKMNNNLDQEIKDKLTKVCLCKGISRLTIKKAIAGGAATVQEVQRATGAGSGSCCGRRCKPKIMDLIEASKDE